MIPQRTSRYALSLGVLLLLVYFCPHAGAQEAPVKIRDADKGLHIEGKLAPDKKDESYWIKLVKGAVYVIDMMSPHPKDLDPFLRLLDPAGKVLAQDDDGGIRYLAARIVFLSPKTACYRVVATSFGGRGAGAFRLEIKRDDARLGDFLERRITALVSKDDYAGAIAAARELAKTQERYQGPKHWQTADAIRLLHTLEKVASLSTKARADFMEAVRSNSLAIDLKAQHKYAAAAPLCKKALALRRKILGEEHPYTASSYNNLAANLNAQGQYAAAGRFYEKALAIHRKILGEEHPDTAWSYNNLAHNLNAEGKYADAAPLYETALAIRRKILGEEHPDTAWSYNNLSANLYARANYAAGAKMAENALIINRKLLGEEHPETARSYNNLAANLNAQGKYAEAAPRYEKALAIWRELLGEEHLDTAGAYNNLAANLHAAGKHADAAPLFAKALAIHRQLLGEEHPATATSHNNLAHNLNGQGEYSRAAPFYEKALAIRRQILGEEHPETASSYNNLAANLNAQSNYAAATPLLAKALAIRRQILGEEHADTASSYNNLAANLADEGKYADAATLDEKALTIRRKILGEEHPDTAQSYNNLAYTLNAQGKYASATPLYQRALAIRRKVLGEEHPDTASSYNNLAANLEDQRRFAAAAPLYEKALAICRTVLGEDHPDTAMTYGNLAHDLSAQGRYTDTEVVLMKCARTFAAARLRVTRTRLDAASFAAKHSPYAALAACRARIGKPIAAWESLEAGLARGLLGELSTGAVMPLTPDEHKRQQALNATLNRLDKQIGKLLATRTRDQASQKQLAALIEERKKVQSGLAQLAAVLAEREVFARARIQKHIPPDTAFIVWVDIQGRPKEHDPNGEHWACVLRHSGAPEWIKLSGSGPKGEWTKEDDDLPGTFRRAAAERASPKELQRLRDRIRAQRLQALAPFLAARNGLPAVRRLIVAPVGWMAGVPLEAFIDEYVVSYIPSGSIWARLQEEGHVESRPMTLLAIGDPVFHPAEKLAESAPPPNHGVLLVKVLPGSNAARSGLKTQDVLLQYGPTKLPAAPDLPSAVKAQAKETVVPVTVWRGGRTFTAKLAPGALGVQISRRPAAEAILAQREGDRILRAARGPVLSALPGSRREVEALARLLPGESVLKLLGSDASEQRLADLNARGELKRYRYLHFATHGAANSDAAFQSAILLAQDKLPDPAEARRGSNFIDGRLTADELLNWKLDAALVTLSACQSGLGKPGGGEGYLGFSQALFKAGARSLVVSLWKVDDRATAMLMKRFYQNLLGRRPGLQGPMPRAEALAEAKKWLRCLTAAEVKQEEESLPRGERIGTGTGHPRPLAGLRPLEHPYFWAAFVLIGDAR